MRWKRALGAGSGDVGQLIAQLFVREPFTPEAKARMDAAIELTHAERGVVLLVSERSRGRGQLRVAVARNFDREQVERSRMKFSRGIAEQVVETGEPLITADD